jgi:CubicO group peptidase (beta-lactamase class C family)
MRIRFPAILICIFLMFISKIISQENTELNSSFKEELSLRCMEPIDSIISDLKEFIPQYMKIGNIPGIQIALIHDGKTVWTEGFGVANKFTGKPVTSETLFEVASNSDLLNPDVALEIAHRALGGEAEPLRAAIHLQYDYREED